VATAPELEQYRSLPLFAELGDSALRRVQELVTELRIPAGQILVHAGDPGAGLFVLQEGTAVVEGRGNLRIEVGPGEFVGELALLVPDATRSARVRAQTDVRCLAIGANDFKQLLRDEPQIALAMLPVLAERLWRARSDD
jgi:CRP-like cAMP-binding protein